MDVSGALNKLDKLRSTLTSGVTTAVFSTVSTVKDVLPGNPVTRDFEVNEHVASGGPGLLWKIYSGSKKSTKEPAAVFVLEKRLLDAHFPVKQERDALLDQLRRAVAQLTRLRHPQVLTVQHPLEESRDSLAFATEPVYASLANVLGRHDNLPSPVPTHLRDYKLFDVEIKYGLLQLCEGLAFLHDSVKLLHRNISPESIILNHQGAWKIFGFDFCLQNTQPNGVNPNWDFPLNDAMASDALSFQKNAQELKQFRESNLQLIPAELKSSLKLMLNLSPDIRPTAEQMSKIPYFEDVGVKTLNNLDTQFQWDNLQKSQFYKGLPHVLPRLPHRVSLHRVVPCLAKEFVNPHMVPFVLPSGHRSNRVGDQTCRTSVLYVAEEASKSDYVTYILPQLKPVMKISDPIQVLLIFMQRMEMLLSKTPPADVKSDVLPMVYRALEADTAQIQELCLSIIPGFAGLLEFQATKTALLPRIKKLCINTGLLSVRVNCLVCIGKLLQHLDKWLVLDDILPMLQQIPSREPAVVMAIIGIYKLTLADSKLGMTKEIIANRVLPFLFPLSIENGLSVQQYNAIMNLIRELIAKVEEEHRAKLEQLNNLQAEQKSALQISMSDGLAKPDQLVPASAAASSGQSAEMDKMYSGLGLDSFAGSKKDTAGSLATGLMDSEKSKKLAPMTSMTSSPGGGGALSLEQKQKILRDSETQKRMSGQSPLAPMSLGGGGKSNHSVGGTKDLTASLISSNLNQMKHTAPSSAMKSSQSFSSGWGSNAAPSAGMSSAANWSGMNTGPSMFGGQTAAVNSLGASNSFTSAAAGNSKPDLSAFDDLLPMKSKSPVSMNAMAPGGVQPMQPSSISMSSAKKPPVKSLTTNDINDLLG